MSASLYLNQTDAGAFLGLSPRTLERFRVDGRGPRYLKLGRRVAYAREDLMSWAESRRRSSTSTRAAAAQRRTSRAVRDDWQPRETGTKSRKAPVSAFGARVGTRAGTLRRGTNEAPCRCNVVTQAAESAQIQARFRASNEPH